MLLLHSELLRHDNNGQAYRLSVQMVSGRALLRVDVLKHSADGLLIREENDAVQYLNGRAVERVSIELL